MEKESPKSFIKKKNHAQIWKNINYGNTHFLYDAHFTIKEVWKLPKINGVTIIKIPMQFVQLPLPHQMQ